MPHGLSPQAGPIIPIELRADIKLAKQAIQKYQQTRQVMFLDRAFRIWETVLHSSAFQRSKLDFQLAEMGESGGVLLRRYQAQGNMEDLEQALKWTKQVVDLTPQGSPVRGIGAFRRFRDRCRLNLE